MSDQVIHPAEQIALTVALAQLKRSDPVSPNIATAVVLALGRIAGRVDYDLDAMTYEIR